jgi:hypothetical protein
MKEENLLFHEIYKKEFQIIFEEISFYSKKCENETLAIKK